MIMSFTIIIFNHGIVNFILESSVEKLETTHI